MDNVNDLLFRFKEHLAVLNRSPATIETYTDHVRGFLDTLDGDDIRKVTREVIKEYIAGLYDYRTKDDKPYRINTIILKVRAVKRFFEFLEGANIVFINPAESIKEPKKPKNLPKEILTRKDKVGFATPEYLWLKDLKKELEAYFTPQLQEYLNVKKLLNDWNMIVENQPKTGSTILWRLINFAAWKKIYGL